MKRQNQKNPIISTPSDTALLAEMKTFYERITASLSESILGQPRIIDETLTAIFAGGHALILGVPGLGKTLLVRRLAALTAIDFGRIQFTPDMMPGSVLGWETLQEEGGGSARRREMVWTPGPVFTNLLLADEINRTPPRTQAALLEAMEERQVTVDGKVRPLPKPFIVLATENPIEQEGTYPLPEAQLDRFLFCLKIDYPQSAEDEVAIVLQTTGSVEKPRSPIITREKFLEFLGLVRRIPVPEAMARLAVTIVRRTRPTSSDAPESVRRFLNWGASPRAARDLILGAKSAAALRGEPVVSPSDVRRLAAPVLRHRLVLNYQAAAEDLDADGIIEKIVASVD